MSIIDAASHAVISTLPVGKRPWGIALSADGRYLYTANGGSNDISIVDLSGKQPARSIAVGQKPWGIAVLH